MASVLVVDDDSEIAELVASALRGDGHDVDIATSGPYALDFLATNEKDLVVLDLEMPLMNGHELAAAIRETSGIRILMLTAAKDEEERITALMSHVDDYMTKPFNPSELRARVTALMRRELIAPTRLPSLTVNSVRRKAVLAGKDLQLTETEFGLLSVLYDSFPKAAAKAALIDHVWGHAEGASSHTLDVHLHRLRTKLAGTAIAVASVRGVGFRLIAV